MRHQMELGYLVNRGSLENLEIPGAFANPLYVLDDDHRILEGPALLEVYDHEAERTLEAK